MKPFLQSALAVVLILVLCGCAARETSPQASGLRRGPTSQASATQAIEAEAKADAAKAAKNTGTPPEAPRPAVAKAVESVYPALVRIAVVTTEPEGGRLQKYQSGGSGAIISADGHVITNHHVAGKARQIFCVMPDGEKIEATLIGTDALADISILQLKPDPALDPKASSRKWPVAAFGDSDKLRIGDVVYAMGSPSAISQSVTRGIVSNTRMTMPELLWPMTFRLDGEEVGTLVRWIGHDAVIFGGNSGGPLVNEDGQIVGINEIGIASMGGAIPSNLAKSVAEQIIAGGSVNRSWIGIEAQPRLLSSRAAAGDGAAKGVLVGGVIKDSPADKAGLKPGDVVTHYEGVEVDCSIPEELPLFNRLILGTPIGKTVPIEIRRNAAGRNQHSAKQTATITTIGRETAQGKGAGNQILGHDHPRLHHALHARAQARKPRRRPCRNRPPRRARQRGQALHRARRRHPRGRRQARKRPEGTPRRLRARRRRQGRARPPARRLRAREQALPHRRPRRQGRGRGQPPPGPQGLARRRDAGAHPRPRRGPARPGRKDRRAHHAGVPRPQRRQGRPQGRRRHPQARRRRHPRLRARARRRLPHHGPPAPHRHRSHA